MSEHGYGACEPLHVAPGKTADVTIKHGSFDLSYYRHSHMAIAWLGVHAVAVYDAADKVLLPSPEVTAKLQQWADSLNGSTDDDTITLTERGRVEANLSHAMRATQPGSLLTNPPEGWNAVPAPEYRSGASDTL